MCVAGMCVYALRACAAACWLQPCCMHWACVGCMLAVRVACHVVHVPTMHLLPTWGALHVPAAESVCIACGTGCVRCCAGLWGALPPEPKAATLPLTSPLTWGFHRCTGALRGSSETRTQRMALPTPSFPWMASTTTSEQVRQEPGAHVSWCLGQGQPEPGRAQPPWPVLPQPRGHRSDTR